MLQLLLWYKRLARNQDSTEMDLSRFSGERLWLWNGNFFR